MLDRYWQSVVDGIRYGANDLEILEIVYLLIKNEVEKLNSSDNYGLEKYFNKLSTIELELKNILEYENNIPLF